MVIMKHLISKRYKDIFAQYIHKGEPTPLSVGTIAVLGLCFLLLIIATFSQFSFNFAAHNISYSPLIPIMLFIIYILGITIHFYCSFCIFWQGFLFGRYLFLAEELNLSKTIFLAILWALLWRYLSRGSFSTSLKQSKQGSLRPFAGY